MLAKTSFTKIKKRIFRRGQAGQSLILLAIGFIALTAFVGIVTDVSLLFVRYSTLRRAVDAAAVAAAGQMRRVPDDDGSSVVSQVPLPGEDEGQSVSIANLNLAARQFIEVYGLDTSRVLAETCYAQNVYRDPTTLRPRDNGSPREYLYLYDGTGKVTGDNPAANTEVRERYEELCKDNELKLVRVTAQIESPTVFLRLLGIPSLTLTESSISQTAVLDVVLILDVSESMAYQTTYDDWANPDNIPDANGDVNHYPYRYVPPKVWTQDRDTWNLELRVRSMTDILSIPNPDTGMLKYGVVPIGSSPPAVYLDAGGSSRTGPTVSFLPDDAPLPATPTRVECQVRVAPTSTYGTGANIPAWLRAEYEEALGDSWVAQRFDTFNAGAFRSFLPMYNSYACCNDPNGDWDFGDLVCQPFKDVRDATSEFLEHLDFIRGDRVAFVTFDHSAYIIDPDGTGGQSPMIEAQNDLNIIGDGVIDPSINERYGAQRVLNSVAGVRAEPSFYASSDSDLLWDGLLDYDPGSGTYTAHDWPYFQNTAMNSIYLQPSISSCWLDRAILLPPQVHLDTQLRETGRVSWTLLPDAMDSPDWWWDTSAARPPTTADPDDDPIYSYWNSFFWNNRPDLRSVEYRAGCGGGNIGAALGRAQEALVDYGRTEGAVWLMVLLSDGASGISDPIRRDEDTELLEPDVYRQLAGYSAPLTGSYGAFGVCPYGTNANRGELLSDPSNAFPFCSDIDPKTRSFCSTLPLPPTELQLEDPACSPSPEQYNESLYDADDYAHDWADWVALADLNYDAAQSSVQRSSNEQLPTIFTIGIGLEYSPFNSVTGVRQCADEDWGCRKDLSWNYEDYLGEQLLRYIADAGDNNRIDDDYWQCRLARRVSQSVIPADPLPGGHTLASYIQANCEDKADVDWGVRGPCETPSSNPNERGIWSPLDPRESCGNYFAAAETSDLEQVFGVIASRMFTRLSQ